MLYKYVKNESYLQQLRPKPKISKSNLITSITCLLLGTLVLLYSIYPYLNNYINKNKSFSRILLTSSPQSKIDIVNASRSSNTITSNYLTNVGRNFSLTNQVLNIDKKTFSEYSNIKGEIRLSIPSLKLDNLKTELNVDSFDENNYLPILEKSLGHFKGTSLPDRNGNTFIYGHSANQLLARTYPNNPKYAFSFLGNMNIGDEIMLEYNGKQYKYSTQKFKMVKPDDLSPIYTTSDEKTLTLMTCWPPGIGSERLIVTSKLIE